MCIRDSGADTWHDDLGTTGDGVKIGIIDSNFAEIDTLFGTELPPEDEIEFYCGSGSEDFNNCINGDNVHGTWVSQIVHDVAPDADLYISNSQNSVGDMIASGVDVITMSLGYAWVGPGDGTSEYSPNSILDVIDTAIEGGAVWVNSAGNYNEGSWLGDWTDDDNDGWHEWNSNADGFASTSVPDANETTRLKASSGNFATHLRWEGDWGGEDTDLDIVLTDSDNNILNTYGDEQDGDSSDKPYDHKCMNANLSLIHISEPTRPY